MKRNTRDAVADLYDSHPTSSDNILLKLKENWNAGIIDTSIGSNIMVHVRPHSNIKSDSKQMALNFSLDPEISFQSVFDLTANAYLQLKTLQNDQSILLLGDANSGKSYSFDHIVTHLMDLARVGGRKTRTATLTAKSVNMLSMFTSAYSVNGPGSTTCIRYNEYQFSLNGKFVGTKTINYLHDIHLLTSRPRSSRNFDIFYVMLRGMPSSDKEQLSLNNDFEYLNSHDFKMEMSDDGAKYKQLINDFQTLGLGEDVQKGIFQTLAAILHLGNIEIVRGNYESTLLRRKHEPKSAVKNKNVLEITAKLMGLDPNTLETTLISKTVTLRNDRVSKLLNVEDAKKQRDNLARNLYSNLIYWITNYVNEKLCKNDGEYNNYIAVLDIPGMVSFDNPEEQHEKSRLQRFLYNYTNEKLSEMIFNTNITMANDFLASQKIPEYKFIVDANTTVMDFYCRLETGAIRILNQQTCRGTSVENDFAYCQYLQKIHGESPIFLPKRDHQFAVSHFGALYNYDVIDWNYENLEAIQSEFVTMVRGSPEEPGTTNVFLRTLFSDKIIETLVHDLDPYTVVAAQTKTISRSPASSTINTSVRSMTIKRGKVEVENTTTFQYQLVLEDLLSCISSTKMWLVQHISPNKSMSYSRSWDDVMVHRQVNAGYIPSLANHPASPYGANLNHSLVVKKFANVLNFLHISLEDPAIACSLLILKKGWGKLDALNGTDYLLLSNCAFRQLCKMLAECNSTRMPKQEPISVKRDSMLSNDKRFSMNETQVSWEHETVMHLADVAQDDQKRAKFTKQAQEDKPLTLKRKVWLAITTALTFYIPNIFLEKLGKMNRQDRRTAWKEKLALMIIFVLLNLIVLFVIIALGPIICPAGHQLSPGQLQSQVDFGKGTVYMYGQYYAVNGIASDHIKQVYTQGGQPFWTNDVLGRDVSALFPKDLYWDTYCPSFSKPVSFQLHYGNLPYGWQAHVQHDYIPLLQKNVAGKVVWGSESISDYLQSTENAKLLIAYDKVYDITPFYVFPNQTLYNFMGPTIGQIFDRKETSTGTDLTFIMEGLRKVDAQLYAKTMQCLNGMFYVGAIDHRNDLKCLIPNYILFGFSCILVFIIGIKFLAALRVGVVFNPEAQARFLLCLIPCYTEDEESLKRTINSVATADYDDKHRMLFIVCDGMIIGGGNDRPTPRIVLDILGVDAEIDSEPFAYQALGSGYQQLNYAKVFSGLYDIEGKLVPFIVVIKAGKPSETSRAGNRGKRDSQLILMQFLSRLFYQEMFNPLEFHLYHTFKNIMGVDPNLYEYLLMVDADTSIERSSLNRLVGHMVQNRKVIGVAGDTKVENEKENWVTMIQIYEYFISQHMTKAFESMFGSVTCLPGCFSLYRIKHEKKPYLIHKKLLSEYSLNQLDTLHLKNLLYLGEDRFLTTLLLKHFPSNSTGYRSDAVCKTIAPDTFAVLKSQRRRWINSTIHNLVELLYQENLCNACCFSMRIIVFLDLLVTFAMPSSILYMVYLIYYTVANPDAVLPIVSIIMIASVFGIQIVLFALNAEIEKFGWMLVYLVAMPIFGIYLPFYSIWNMDDFSWGNTRVVYEQGKKVEKELDETVFDPDMIPLTTLEGMERKQMNVPAPSSQLAYSRAVSPSTTIVPKSPSDYGLPDGNGSTSIVSPNRRFSNNSQSSVTIHEIAESKNIPRMEKRSSISSSSSLKLMEDRSNYSDVSSTHISALQETEIRSSVLKKHVDEFLMNNDINTATKGQIRRYVEDQLKVSLTEKQKRKLFKIVAKEMERLGV
ncbi:hypothetical protein HK103_005548 [Boothiomyces macroporosus]|uniref:chitin synthase n=1 Tax=Boothiomyces macroporosus TaxID=261099 RepID=A0AAD5UI17_9FUNG|nr:hypothetical protein HK103_005548 [Boothiomyces macroporosus]